MENRAHYLTLDTIRRLVKEGIMLSPDAAQVLVDEIGRLTDKVDQLTEALQPFSDHGISSYIGNGEEIRCYDDGSGSTNLTVGDIRRAAEANHDATS